MPSPRPARTPIARAPRASWALALVSAAACGPEEPGGRARNAILISIDTLRADHLGCYGHERPTSPTLDALAARGVRFADVTAAAPWTLPSHASLLTGVYPAHHGVLSHETRLPGATVTLAEELQAAGFQTLAVVNSHNLGAPQYQLGQGFESFRYITETEQDERTLKLRTPDLGEVVVATARELLERRARDRPFFLFLHFYDVHTDFTPREEYRRMFVEPYAGKLDGRTQQLNGVRNRGERLGEDDLRWLRQMYEAEIRQLDDVLARFLEWLRAQGGLEDTVLVVTSDHGEEFQEHGSVLHGRTQYQELLRVPLILCGPGVPAGVVVEEPVHAVDVAPTLLALLGVASSQARDGLDLAPVWNGGALPARTLFAQADQDNRYQELVDRRRMARRGAHKLVVDLLQGRTELFDLARDPLERLDLLGERPELGRELQVELERFLAGAVQPEPIPPPTAEQRAALDAMGYGGGADGK